MERNASPRFLAVCLLPALALVWGCSSAADGKKDEKQQDEGKETADDGKQQPIQRKFRFTYGATITDLIPGAKARVWIPVAQSSGHQKVEVVEVELPADHQETKDKLGNVVYFFEAVADEQGEIPIAVTYQVIRKEVLPTTGDTFEAGQKDMFLRADKMVPVGGKPVETILGDTRPKGDTMTVARMLYDKVDNHVKYDKPEGGEWGRGDAVWVCDSKYGNCTDFHSLFIAVSRSQQIPARFEMGFPIPTEHGAGAVGGYHCWAWFANGDKWVPVDISEADKHPEMKDYYFGHLTPDRVTFTQGRDLELEPAPAAGTVNFLVYPYVEVDGKQHTKFSKAFAYEDVD